MDADGLALARALVALRGWRWMPRMHLIDTDGRGATVICVHPQSGAIVHRDGAATSLLPVSDVFMGLALPDLDDDATGGVLLAMLGGDAVSIALDDRAGAVFVVGEDADVYLSLGRACAAVMIERG